MSEKYNAQQTTNWTGNLINDGLTPWQNWRRLIRQLVEILRGGPIRLETWVPRSGIRVVFDLYLRQGRVSARWHVPDPVLEIARQWYEEHHHTLN